MNRRDRGTWVATWSGEPIAFVMIAVAGVAVLACESARQQRR